jgi:hypothetical protein
VPLHASENFTGTPLPAFVTLTVRSADRRSRESKAASSTVPPIWSYGRCVPTPDDDTGADPSVGSEAREMLDQLGVVVVAEPPLP